MTVGQPENGVVAGSTGILIPEPVPLADRFGIRTPQELKVRAAELGGTEYIIEGLFPKQSLSLVVGDSGLGKSALLYQAALSVASGEPFLEKNGESGRCRTRFRDEAEHDSGLIPNAVPA
jgi:hypothetical protein